MDERPRKNVLQDAHKDPFSKWKCELELARWVTYFRHCEKSPHYFADEPLLIDRFVSSTSEDRAAVPKHAWPALHDGIDEIERIAQDTRAIRLAILFQRTPQRVQV